MNYFEVMDRHDRAREFRPFPGVRPRIIDQGPYQPNPANPTKRLLEESGAYDAMLSLQTMFREWNRQSYIPRDATLREGSWTEKGWQSIRIHYLGKLFDMADNTWLHRVIDVFGIPETRELVIVGKKMELITPEEWTRGPEIVEDAIFASWINPYDYEARQSVMSG